MWKFISETVSSATLDNRRYLERQWGWEGQYPRIKIGMIVKEVEGKEVVGMRVESRQSPKDKYNNDAAIPKDLVLEVIKMLRQVGEVRENV